MDTVLPSPPTARNGPVHRFLAHNVLARTGFSPPGVIFPVSVSIVRDMPAYDATLESFSRPPLSLLLWDFLENEHRVVVTGETADHYRYFDATRLAEYLYARVAETIRKDLAEERRGTRRDGGGGRARTDAGRSRRRFWGSGKAMNTEPGIDQGKHEK